MLTSHRNTVYSPFQTLVKSMQKEFFKSEQSIMLRLPCSANIC